MLTLLFIDDAAFIDHCNRTFKQIPITVKMVNSRCEKAEWWLAEIYTLYLILPLVFIAFTVIYVN